MSTLKLYLCKDDVETAKVFQHLIGAGKDPDLIKKRSSTSLQVHKGFNEDGTPLVFIEDNFQILELID